MQKTKDTTHRLCWLRISIVLLLCSVTSVYAQGQVGRYVTVEPVAEANQRFPLIQISDFEIPPEVNSVREGMDHVLAGTGYTLAPQDFLDPESLPMLNAPIASTQRSMSNVSVMSALAALAGPGFEVIVDPLSRRVALDVCLHRPETVTLKQRKRNEQ